jgi:hypothetical protein
MARASQQGDVWQITAPAISVFPPSLVVKGSLSAKQRTDDRNVI